VFYGEERAQPVAVSGAGHPKAAACLYPETPAHAHKPTIIPHTCAVEEPLYSGEERASGGPGL